jgi:hypothetical protein
VSRTRRLIDLETHQAVFTWVLHRLADAGLARYAARNENSVLVTGEPHNGPGAPPARPAGAERGTGPPRATARGGPGTKSPGLVSKGPTIGIDATTLKRTRRCAASCGGTPAKPTTKSLTGLADAATCVACHRLIAAAADERPTFCQQLARTIHEGPE